MPQQVDASRIGELKEVVAGALGRGRRATGASQAEADASLQRGLTVTVRLGEVDTIEYHRDRGLSVTVYFGKAKGSASTADLRPTAVRETVLKAAAIARHTAADECAGLADPDELAREIPDLDLFHPWDIEPEQAVALARECEAAGLACDARLKNSEGATLTTHNGVRVYGNSHRLSRRACEHQPLAQLRAGGAGAARICSATTGTRWRAIRRRSSAAEPIGRRAAERALRAARARGGSRPAARAGAVRT